MHLISVVIITYNEERNIGRCLQSVQGIADEIIVVDSLSTDGTAAICAQYNVQFITQPFLGYIEQKNLAKQLATYPYILSLDADEALSPALHNAIMLAKKTGFTADTYCMKRCTNFCGRWIRHGTWYPDKKLRLFNRNSAAWYGTNPHDKLQPLPGATRGHLTGDILHYSYYTIEELVTQTNKFTTIQAKAMFDSGKKSSILKMLFNPWWAFVNGYILKLGFLDGRDGFLIAANIAYQTLLKYSKLKRLHHKKNEPLTY